MTLHEKLCKTVLSSDSEGKNNRKEELEEEEDMNSDSDSDAQSCYGSDIADESMEEDEEEEEEEHELPPSPPKPRAKSAATNGLTQDQEDDENVLPTNKGKLRSKGAVSVPPTTNNMDNEDEEAERVPARVLKKARKTNKENVSPNKRKSETRPEEDEKQEPTQKKLKAAEYLAPNDKPKITVLRILAKCPKNRCGEALPETSLSPYLRRLLEEQQIQLDTPDNSRRTVEELEGRICARICSENKCIHVLKHGCQQGWPLSFDLMLMVTFIIGLETEILDLVTNSAELGCCVAFVNFVNAIGGRIHEFGRDGLKNFAPAQFYSRAGYFGPKGKDVIIETMARIFAPHFPQLKTHLVTTLSSIISSNRECFDAPAQGTLPEILSIYDFMDFVLLPHITAHMISDDMQVFLEDAEEIRTRSIEFGQLVHWNLQDPALLAALSSPPDKYTLRPNPDHNNDQSPVATKGSRSVQKEVELTLDDFPMGGTQEESSGTQAENRSEAKVGQGYRDEKEIKSD
ncbi:hypothetical protein B0H14DRAFT_3882117 [Mycena olivaceomarginata]|nr:hypothetical protein B0H14DRAFT_3882117 [Mycena olivaceomarginata]